MKKIVVGVAFAMLWCFNCIGAMTAEDTIASTLWLEARGEGREGIKAVASVIANRAKKSGKTYAFECLKAKQFSCWNDRARDVPRNANGKAWEFCKSVARQMVAGKFKPTNKATHYYNFHICKPKWGSAMRDVVVIGNHRFGRV
jgi:N-acetylmuramoyl-L-alanine amidase